MHDAVGVEIIGLDLGDGSVLEAAEVLRDCVHRHGCALMRDQNLPPPALSRLGRALGEPLPPYRPQYSLPDFPEIIRVGNLVEDGEVAAYLNRGGVEWHSDSPGSSRPPAVSLLYCLESVLPEGGGEVFADTAIVIAHENAKRAIVGEQRPTAVPALRKRLSPYRNPRVNRLVPAAKIWHPKPCLTNPKLPCRRCGAGFMAAAGCSSTT